MSPVCRSVGSLCLTATPVLLLSASFAQAQMSAPANPPLDPNSPMANLPDIGVAWPDMKESITDQSAQNATKVLSEEQSERRYAISIEGLERIQASPVRDRFDQLSVLRQGQGKVANIAQIDRRTREDRSLLESILRTSGYYDAQVEATVENGAAGPLTVHFVVVAGPLYHFRAVKVQGLKGTGIKAEAFGAVFGVDNDDVIDADDVVSGRTALEKALKESGYPFANVSEPEVEVDHDTRSGTLAMNVSSGGERNFGHITVKSAKPPFDARHVNIIARFRQGERYDQKQIEDLRRALVATGIVGAVDIKALPGSTADTADIDVALEPAPLHTITAEAGYGTGEGPRVEASWTHRNLFPPEGALTLRGVLGTREQSAGLLFQKSNFLRRDNVFKANLLASHFNEPAYEARTIKFGLGLERQSNIIWQKRWTWSVGAEVLATDETNITTTLLRRRQTYFIAALPLALTYDRSDNLLDPTRGFRLGVRLGPEMSFQGGTTAYLRAQLDGSAYLPVSQKVVIAGRARMGSVFSTQTLTLAPSRRFYAGGGGSVRGFGYQAIGPRDAFNDPVGGRSLTEFSLEARIRKGDFGIVPFIDAGNISDSELPTLKGFRVGAGVGLRYHSSFGPIRIDLGTPINPQPGDSRITVFVSLGQAF